MILGNGTLLVATSHGVSAGSPDGRGYVQEFSSAEGDVVELASDPTDPNAAFALLAIPGIPTAHTALRRRSAAGVWSAFGGSDAAIATGLRLTVHEGRLPVALQESASTQSPSAVEPSAGVPAPATPTTPAADGGMVHARASDTSGCTFVPGARASYVSSHAWAWIALAVAVLCTRRRQKRTPHVHERSLSH
ncbi:MAG: hypothetical protein RL701_4581 [Pseudomonadota bacterium]